MANYQLKSKNQKDSKEPQDFRERFEFRLTVGDNIICQRYFKINNFNPVSLKSLELAETITQCTRIINDDLKSKTADYLSVVSPKIFNSLEEMTEYFKDEEHKKGMVVGEGIAVRNSDTSYVWGINGEPLPFADKIDFSDFVNELTDDDSVDYKFGFYVDGKERCSAIWTGVYPKYIRSSIDLSNAEGRIPKEEVSLLGYDRFLRYYIAKDRVDLIYGLIRLICLTCSDKTENYTTKYNWGKKKYSNVADYKIWQNDSKRKTSDISE